MCSSANTEKNITSDWPLRERRRRLYVSHHVTVLVHFICETKNEGGYTVNRENDIIILEIVVETEDLHWEVRALTLTFTPGSLELWKILMRKWDFQSDQVGLQTSKQLLLISQDPAELMKPGHLHFHSGSLADSRRVKTSLQFVVIYQ